MGRFLLSRRLAPLGSFVLIFAGLVAVNVLASFAPLRLDVTEERIYTLSKGTREILQGLPHPVTVKFYFTEGLADLPLNLVTHARNTRELLRAYERSAGGNLRLEVYNPKPDTETEAWARRYGLQPAQLPTGNALYLGLVLISEDRESALPFLDPRRERFLEYDITSALSRISRKPAQIGILSSFRVEGGSPFGERGKPWSVLRELQRSYEVTVIPDGSAENLSRFDLLLVVHPRGMSLNAQYALDQFLLRGGRMILLLDPHARMDPATNMKFSPPPVLGVPQLMQAWGVAYNSTKVVGDLRLGANVSTPNGGQVRYPLWISLNTEQLQGEMPITSELEDVTFIEGGSFSAGEDMPLRFVPLIRSSAESGTVDASAIRIMPPLEVIKSLQTDEQEHVLAALLSGSFPSAFPKGAPTAEQADAEEKQKPQEDEAAEGHLSEAQAESTVLLIGDADFLADPFSVRQVSFFGNAISQPVNDNLAFLVNAVEFLSGEVGLIRIRSRGRVSRPFTRVAALQADAAQRFRVEEAQISQQLRAVQSRLSELEKQTPQGKTLLSREVLETIRSFRLEEQRTRRALRDVRKLLREDIESLGQRLLALNLLAMPLIVAILGFWLIRRRVLRSGARS